MARKVGEQRMSYFPVMIDLEKKHVLIIGGQKTALRKANQMKQFGADIHIISESICEELRFDSHQIRSVQPSDITPQYDLIIAATNQKKVNAKIAQLCQKQRILVNVVDDPALCTFIFPAIVKQDDVIIGISSSGNSPLLTQWIKKQIQTVLPHSLGKINAAMGTYRRQIIQSVKDPARRKQLLQDKLNEWIREAKDD